MTLVELGRAETQGQRLPLGVDDPIPAARAVRRSLAAAKRHATDVDLLIVVTDDPQPDETLRRFARRALGPHGESVDVASVRGSAIEVSTRVAELVRRMGLVPGRVVVTVVVGRGGECVARCQCVSAEPPSPPGGPTTGETDEGDEGDGVTPRR